MDAVKKRKRHCFFIFADGQMQGGTDCIGAASEWAVDIMRTGKTVEIRSPSLAAPLVCRPVPCEESKS